MDKYKVLVTLDTTASTLVEVEAESPEQAEDKAIAEVRAEPHEWVPDDNDWVGDPYIADPGNSAELVA